MARDAAPSAMEARRQSQRRRALVTLLVVALGLFFAVWYAWSYIKQDDNRVANKPVAPTCRPYDATVATPGRTKVNVYNASTREGLAGSTSKTLASRGFLIGDVANDPLKKRLATIGEVRYGPKGLANAKLLLTVLPKGVTGVKDARKDASVDLVLGQKWSALPPAPSSTQLPMCPAPSPSTS
ncbi:MAG: LytR C-terminal domain-containing protein [Tetrasphaera sp.]|nr:LytR C-terminal domain-containing protein [Tetrasphaera sp.]